MFSIWPFSSWSSGYEWNYSRFYPLVTQRVHRLAFQVKARHEAVIKLYRANGAIKDNLSSFMIILGDFGNSSTSIVSSTVYRVRSSEEILSPTEYRKFWITVYNGVVKVGRVGNSKALISLDDPEQAKVEYWFFEFSSREGACCQWIYPERPLYTHFYGKVGNNEYLDFFPLPLNQQGALELIFRAQSDLIAGISFLRDNITSKGYEIIFGKFGETACKLYVRGHIVKEHEYGELSGSEYTGYWIKIYQDIITIGFEKDTKRNSPFLVYNVSSPVPIGCYSLLATPTPVNYQCSFVEESGFKSYKKWNGRGYVNYFPLALNPDKSIKLEFTVPSCSDKGILLQEECDPERNFGYELRFCNNTVTFYRNKMTKGIVMLSDENYKEHQRYCLNIIGSLVEVFYGFGMYKYNILSVVDPYPLAVQWFSFKVCECPTCTRKTCYCLGSYKYSFTNLSGLLHLTPTCISITPLQKKMVRLNEFIVYIQVRTESDAHILLSEIEEPSEDVPVYEIVLGAHGNTKTYLRRQRRGTNVAIAETPDMVSDYEFRGFWIIFTAGTLSIGKFGIFEPIIVWYDPSPLNINYLSYSLKELTRTNKDEENNTRFVITMPETRHRPINTQGRRKSTVTSIGSFISRESDSKKPIDFVVMKDRKHSRPIQGINSQWDSILEQRKSTVTEHSRKKSSFGRTSGSINSFILDSTCGCRDKITSSLTVNLVENYIRNHANHQQ